MKVTNSLGSLLIRNEKMFLWGFMISTHKVVGGRGDTGKAVHTEKTSNE